MALFVLQTKVHLLSKTNQPTTTCFKQCFNGHAALALASRMLVLVLLMVLFHKWRWWSKGGTHRLRNVHKLLVLEGLPAEGNGSKCLTYWGLDLPNQISGATGNKFRGDFMTLILSVTVQKPKIVLGLASQHIMILKFISSCFYIFYALWQIGILSNCSRIQQQRPWEGGI